MLFGQFLLFRNFLTNSSTRFRNFSWKRRPQIGAHPVWPHMDGFGIFVHFVGFLGLFCEKFRYVGNVADLKNMILCYLINLYCFVGKLIVKYELVCPKIAFGEWNQAKVRQESQQGTKLLRNSSYYTGIPDKFLNPVQEFLANSSTQFRSFSWNWRPQTVHIPYGPIWNCPPPPTGTCLSTLPQRNENLMWTVTWVRPCTEAKLITESVSCPKIMWIGP